MCGAGVSLCITRAWWMAASSALLLVLFSCKLVASMRVSSPLGAWKIAAPRVEQPGDLEPSV